MPCVLASGDGPDVWNGTWVKPHGYGVNGRSAIKILDAHHARSLDMHGKCCSMVSVSVIFSA